MVLCIWVNTNAGKMCSGDTRAINEPRACTGSEGRPLPSCWERGCLNEPKLWQPGSGSLTWGPQMKRGSTDGAVEQKKSSSDVAVSGSLLLLLRLKEHVRSFVYGEQFRLSCHWYLAFFFLRWIKSVKCRITTAVILSHDWANILLGGAFVCCRQT